MPESHLNHYFRLDRRIEGIGERERQDIQRQISSLCITAHNLLIQLPRRVYAVHILKSRCPSSPRLLLPARVH